MMRCAALRISRAVVPRMARGLALPPHRVVAMPALSPTMTQGNIAKYVASVGDELEPGDRLAEIETDKATVDFEVVDDGVLRAGAHTRVHAVVPEVRAEVSCACVLLAVQSPSDT